MRKLLLAMCLPILAAGSAYAQVDYSGQAGCHKGIFWPFSREKGDCLTDVEKKNGLTGNYQDPTGTAGVRPAGNTQANVGTAPSSGGSDWSFGLFGGGNAGNGNGGLLDDRLAPNGGSAGGPESGAAPGAGTGGVATLGAPAAGPAKCTKGIFWPFSREKGDCLTDVEKKNGMVGNYRDPTAGAVAAPVANAAPAAGNAPSVPTPNAGAPAAIPATATASAVPAGPVASGAPADAAAAKCSKGIFWPFVREAGDCPTDAEKKNAGDHAAK